MYSPVDRLSKRVWELLAAFVKFESLFPRARRPASKAASDAIRGTPLSQYHGHVRLDRSLAMRPPRSPSNAIVRINR